MRRLFADRLAFATGVIMILMAFLFAFLRVAGFCAGTPNVARACVAAFRAQLCVFRPRSWSSTA